MDTNQLLDLFSVESVNAKSSVTSQTAPEAADKKKNKETGLKAMLDSIGELWDTAEYEEEYNITNFVTNLNK